MTERAMWRMRERLDRASTEVYVDDEGALVVAFRDDSETAHTMMGGETVTLCTVRVQDVPRMRKLLAAEAGVASPDTYESIAACVADRFAGYFDYKAWLEASGVSFTSKLAPIYT